jgi:hypothetical protein
MENDYQDRRRYQIRDDIYQDFKTAFEMLRDLGVDVSAVRKTGAVT